MAFIQKNFSVLAYANGFTLWHYVTPDTAEVVASPHYFARANDMLRRNDMILLNAGDGNGTIVVSESSAETVAIQPAVLNVTVGA